jgi:hypothetical protein
LSRNDTTSRQAATSRPAADRGHRRLRIGDEEVRDADVADQEHAATLDADAGLAELIAGRQHPTSRRSKKRVSRSRAALLCFVQSGSQLSAHEIAPVHRQRSCKEPDVNSVAPAA